jgi:ribonucleoside-diphosphate reductase alpha chain
MHGVSGKQLSDIYLAAWNMGLKTTYYLRTLAASQIEKSTLDASKYGFTQKREYVTSVESRGGQPESADASADQPAEAPQLCRVEDPECEACQ